ncbi:hypothetical protein D3C71_1104280 [compost metagenome]
MGRGDDLVQDLIEWIVDVDEIHAGRGDHHVASGHVGHPDDALEHHAGVGANDLVVFGFGQGFNQFIGGLGGRMDELSDFLQKTALVFLLGRTSRMRV